MLHKRSHVVKIQWKEFKTILPTIRVNNDDWMMMMKTKKKKKNNKKVMYEYPRAAKYKKLKKINKKK